MNWQWVTLVLVLTLQLEVFLLLWFVLRNRHIERLEKERPLRIGERPKPDETTVHPADSPTVVEPPKEWPSGFTGAEAS
jgi:hypothetical protein